MEHDRSQGVTRRTALRGAAVGAGLVWAAPVVTTVATPAFAATSPVCGPTSPRWIEETQECCPEDEFFDAETGECGIPACDENSPRWIAAERRCCETDLDPETGVCGDCDRDSARYNPRTRTCCSEGEKYNASTGTCDEHVPTGAPIALGLAAGTGMVATGATLAALAARRSTVEQADTSDPAASAEPPAAED